MRADSQPTGYTMKSGGDRFFLLPNVLRSHPRLAPNSSAGKREEEKDSITKVLAPSLAEQRIRRSRLSEQIPTIAWSVLVMHTRASRVYLQRAKTCLHITDEHWRSYFICFFIFDSFIEVHTSYHFPVFWE